MILQIDTDYYHRYKFFLDKHFVLKRHELHIVNTQTRPLFPLLFLVIIHIDQICFYPILFVVELNNFLYLYFSVFCN